MKRSMVLLGVPIALIVLIPLQHYISIKTEPVPPPQGGPLESRYPNGTERRYAFDGSYVLSSVLVDTESGKTLSESFYELRLVDGEYRLVVDHRDDYTLWGRSRWYVLGATVLCLVAALLGSKNEEHFWKIPTLGTVAGVLLGFGAGWILEPGRPGGSAAETGGEAERLEDLLARDPANYNNLMQGEVERLEELLARDPTNYDNLVQMGNLHYDMSNFVEAVGFYERARAIRDDSPNLLTDLGTCYRATDPRKALEMYERAWTMDPNHLPSRFNSMLVLFEDLNDLVGARRQLEELKRLREMVPDLPLSTIVAWEERLANAGG